MEDIVEWARSVCVRRRLEDDPNDENGFIIKTISGKDFNINALSLKEKEDWMVQIRAVRRCFLMRQRAEMHIMRKNYKAVRGVGRE